MLRSISTLACAALLAGAALTSCNNDMEEPKIDGQQPEMTRVYGDKTPKVVAYVEVNDTNPLNAGSYVMDNKAFFDIVEIFAPNIRKDSDGDPAVWFNDNVNAIMSDVDKYIRPLQAKGIKVVLTMLGDHQGIGFCNLTDAQVEIYTDILAWVVSHYGVDGIGFDDEYADYSTSLVNGSYGKVIKRLRAKMPAGKLITVFDWGNTDSTQIDATAGAMIDYSYPGTFSPTTYITSLYIAGLTKAHWSPQAINLRSASTYFNLNAIQTNSQNAADNGYGAIMTYDLRIASERNPLTALQRIGTGAFGKTVTYDGNAYTKDWTAGAGLLITKNDIN